MPKFNQNHHHRFTFGTLQNVKVSQSYHRMMMKMPTSTKFQQELMEEPYYLHSDNCHIRQPWDFHTVQLEVDE